MPAEGPFSNHHPPAAEGFSFMAHSRAVIFANGTLPDTEAARRLLRSDDFLIAADGGCRHALACGRAPDVLIGDFDSLEEGLRESLRRAGSRLLSFPAGKDETDLELAIALAVREGYSSVLIIGGLGGRTDQTLANLSLLADPSRAGTAIVLDDGCEEVLRIGPKTVLHGTAGDIVSLLPFGVPAEGVRTEGLRYPLRDETLLPFNSRGVSNRMLSDTAVISVEKGLLLCIHTRIAH
jgi:thiamine pyrophosphokinase